MVILKEGDKICLVNPIRLNEEEEQKLLSMGEIFSILKLGRLHSVDVPYYIDKFKPQLWASKKDSFLNERDYLVDIDLDKTDEIPFMNMKIYSFKTSKENEAVALLPQEDGILLSCDSLVNMNEEDPMANWLVRVLSKLLPTPAYIGPNWFKVMKPKKEDFQNLLKFNFNILIPAHGSALKENAKIKILSYVEKFKF
jgi:hypothetical protein